MSTTTTSRPASLWAVVSAFAIIYIIWGSTYLAIHFAIDTLPPFLMAGSRFLVAGVLLYGWLRMRGTPAPTIGQWRGTAIVGLLLLVGGNGGLVWGEQRIPSGLAALLVATVPIWMVVLDAIQRRTRPTISVIAGLLLGLAGLVVLIGPNPIAGGSGVDLVGAAVILVGALSWAAGSVYARHATMPGSPVLATAMEMLAGGTVLIVLGLAAGEGTRVQVQDISALSALSLLYLIIFGSLVAFTAYVWLLQVSSPTHVSTYAFVNPVVAVFLGWAFAGEPITTRTLLAAAIIVAAVVLITIRGQTRRAAEPETLSRGEAPHRDGRIANAEV